MKKGDIVKGSHRGKDKAKHFIVFLDDTNKETFVGGVFTHSNKFKDNILMKTEHFKPDGFKFDNTYLVKGRFIKLRNWGPFTKIGEMTEMGLEFIENQTSGLQPRSWDEYINILKKMKKGWEIRKLGEIIEIRNGKNQQSVLSKTGKYKIMGSAGNIMGYATDYICEAGTTIIGRKGNISKPIYIDERFWNVDTAFGFYPKNENEIDKRLIYYLCLGIDFGSMNRGTTIPSLVKSELQKIQISYPKSLPEQQRIAAILDEAFAAIAKAKANAEQNLKNAKELFDSYLQGVFDNKGEGWEEKTLEQVSKIFGRGKSRHRPRNYEKLYGGIYPFIQTGDIRNCNHYITEYSQTYSELGLAQSKLWPSGTICITIAANIAETGVLTFDACFPDSVIGLVVNEKIADRDFIEYLLQSFKARIQALGKGSAQANINMGTFENELFPFPPINEQHTIVQKLDALAVETRKLEAIYNQKLNDLEELKKSVLQKAFSGELKTAKALV